MACCEWWAAAGDTHICVYVFIVLGLHYFKLLHKMFPRDKKNNKTKPKQCSSVESVPDIYLYP